ncbi:integral membrane protein 2B-like [Cyprinus carpio]|uniref:Integral membrane protein 2 n=1 Tax=Cyprinus carpio TaxID=7962 RepID=A0A9R0AXL1_CYPCA|nr:integral membrane protein 2B-like [Cyprinus carpio]
MVKLAFNSALGQKDSKKKKKDHACQLRDVEPTVAPYQEAVQGLGCWCTSCWPSGHSSASLVWSWRGACLYRYRLTHERMYFCGVNYREENYKMQDSQEEPDMAICQPHTRRVEARVRVLEDEGVEIINIPVPKFSGQWTPADIVQDSNRRLEAYLALRLNKCYVTSSTPNTLLWMPPRDLLELLVNIKCNCSKHCYLIIEALRNSHPFSWQTTGPMPQSYLVRGKDGSGPEAGAPYKDQILNSDHTSHTHSPYHFSLFTGIQKREALNCHKILHFENKFVVETLICERRGVG